MRDYDIISRTIRYCLVENPTFCEDYLDKDKDVDFKAVFDSILESVDSEFNLN